MCSRDPSGSHRCGARTAKSEDGEEGLLLQGGFLEGYDLHGCIVEEALVGVYEGCEGDE